MWRSLAVAAHRGTTAVCAGGAAAIGAVSAHAIPLRACALPAATVPCWPLVALVARSLHTASSTAAAAGGARTGPPVWVQRARKAKKVDLALDLENESTRNAFVPPDATPGATYLPYPVAHLRHYLIGTDGRVYNRIEHQWVAGTVVAHMRTPTRLLLTSVLGTVPSDDPNKPDRRLTASPWRANAVLLTHGRHAPTEDARVAYRDGDRYNDSLANLYWETRADATASELTRAIAVAAQRPLHSTDAPLEFRLHPRFPHLHVGNDGRIWNEITSMWVAGRHKSSECVVLDYSSTPPERNSIRRDRLVYEAFTGHPPSDGRRLRRRDGNRFNVSFNNLFLLNEEPQLQPHLIQAPRAFHLPPRFHHYVISASGAVVDARDGSDAKRTQDADGRVMVEFHATLAADSVSAVDTTAASPSSPSELPVTELFPVAELVLSVHGKRPPPNDLYPRVIYIDSDPTNLQVNNLKWGLIEDPLEHEVVLARAQGRSLEFARHPNFPAYAVGSDGRVWSDQRRNWIGGTLAPVRWKKGKHPKVNTKELQDEDEEEVEDEEPTDDLPSAASSTSNESTVAAVPSSSSSSSSPPPSNPATVAVLHMLTPKGRSKIHRARMVCEAFAFKASGGQPLAPARSNYVHHLDGDLHNCSLSNLVLGPSRRLLSPGRPSKSDAADGYGPTQPPSEHVQKSAQRKKREKIELALTRMGITLDEDTIARALQPQPKKTKKTTLRTKKPAAVAEAEEQEEQEEEAANEQPASTTPQN